MVIKVCLSIFCYDRNIDRTIATYTDHMKFSMFECNELVENCFPLFCYAPIGK